MNDELIYITNDDKQNIPFVDYIYRLQSLEATAKNLIKAFEPTNKIR